MFDESQIEKDVKEAVGLSLIEKKADEHGNIYDVFRPVEKVRKAAFYHLK